MKPKIQFVTHECSRTGAPLLLLSLLTHTKFSECDVSILCLKDGPLFVDFANLHATTLWQPNDRRRKKPDLYVLCSHSYGFLHQAKAEGIPVVCMVHEGPISFSQLPPETLEIFRTHPFQYIVPSSYVRSFLANNIGIPEHKIDVLNPGIDPSIWLPDETCSSSFKSRLGIPNDTLIVGGMGQIHPRKGTDLWLQIARLIADRMPEHSVHFVWLGSPSSDQKIFSQLLKSDIDRLGLAKQTHFIPEIPEQSDVIAMCNAFDVFAHTSREEPFGMTVLEQLALRHPVVAFETAGGPREILSDAGGILVPRMHAQKFAEEVTFLLKNPARRAALGLTGRTLVCNAFTTGSTARRFSVLMTECITRCRKGTST